MTHTVASPALEIGPQSTQPAGARPRGQARNVARSFMRSRAALIASAFILLLILAAACAPWIAPHNPNQQSLTNRFNPHSGVLGTDEFGRDQFSRLLYGARATLAASTIAVVVAASLGVPLGIAAGYLRGRPDAILGRVSEALQSVPALIFALTVIAVLGPGLINAMLAVGLISLPRFFQVARSSSREIGAETYIEAARVQGASQWRIVLRHVLPNSLPPIVVQLSLCYAAAITAEASLSFLGLGVQVPTASWGSMTASAAKNYRRASYLIYPPGVAIGATVLAFMLVGDGLQRALGARGGARGR